MIQQAIRKPHPINTRDKRPRTDQPLTLRLPIISNRLDTEIRRSLKRHNIDDRIVHTKPRTLLPLAQPRAPPTICKLLNCPVKQPRYSTPFVVYEVTCEICQATYIGSTIRPLHDRAKEHVAAAKKRSRTSAVGEHYERHHRTGISSCDSI